MIPRWKKMKGIGKGKEYCSKCHSYVDEDEFDYEEDMCLYCLFPETSGKKPVELDYSSGYPKNKTKEEKFLEEFESLPEKQTSIKATLKTYGLNRKKSKKKRKQRKKNN